MDREQTVCATAGRLLGKKDGGGRQHGVLRPQFGSRNQHQVLLRFQTEEQQLQV